MTVDFLNQDGIHLGGLITPGLRLMRTSLAQETAELELINQDYPVRLADNTEAAIYSGTLFSIAGLIEHVMLKKPDYQLILTGGDAEIIARQLTIISASTPRVYCLWKIPMVKPDPLLLARSVLIAEDEFIN